MSRRRKPRVGPCTHCPNVGKLTDDHIPPKTLFARRPSDLITVPSCAKCNGGASKDDEYFKLMLVSHNVAGDHPEADLLMPKALRSLFRPEAKGFRKAFEQSMRMVDVYSPGGVYLGKASGYDVNLRRLNRVAKRTVSGLFFHEFGARLPDTHQAIAYAVSGYKTNDAATLEWLKEKCRAIQSSETKVCGEGVLTYWVRRTDEDPNTTGWVLLFYKAVAFIGFTAPKENLPGGAQFQRWPVSERRPVHV
jgi:hypothetical protein